MRGKNSTLTIQQRLVRFVTRSNWILLIAVSLIGLMAAPVDFAMGIAFGGLIVTVNFHSLAKTLKGALAPPYLDSHKVVIAKYYIRFIISGALIFVLISQHIVNPLGLFIGLSVVVASIVMATVSELTKLIFKEAV
jgi:hypothetical protein